MALRSEAGSRLAEDPAPGPPGRRSSDFDANGALLEPSAPLRYAAEPGPGYRYYLPIELLARQLNLFIEAQRAASYVAANIARDAVQQDLKAWVLALRTEKIRWCKVMSADVRALGENPSRAVGGLYYQASPLHGAAAKLVFLNRYEAWLIQRVKAVLPRVQADSVHTDLLSMLATLHRSLGESERALRH